MFSDKTRLIRLISLSTMILTLALLTHGCSDEITPPVGHEPLNLSGTLVHATECKENEYGFDAGAPTVLDCVFWEWDGSDTLRVVHLNAALNCCPGTIVGLIEPVYNAIYDNQDDTQLVGLNITETEGDDALMCHCLCLYDLSYEIAGIEGGALWIRFFEEYLDEGAEPLYISIDLDAEPSGSHCVQRFTYPWNTGQAGEDPIGMIDNYSGCKDVTGTNDDAGSLSADSACVILYNFPADNLLRIYQTNTAYNCCVDALDADFEFAEGLITITGIEHPPGGLCDCICLYDVNYSIANYEQAVTTIRFVEPYLPVGQEQLEITVDLSREGTWKYCVQREGYPWDVEFSEEQDQAKLKELFERIVDYIGTPYCSGDDDCRVIGTGSKPCGGPWMFLIYSASTVDEQHLQALVSEHASFEDYMNMKYGYMSTCDVPVPPPLECRDGICVAAW